MTWIKCGFQSFANPVKQSGLLVDVQRSLVGTHIDIIGMRANDQVGDDTWILRRIKHFVDLIAYLCEFWTVPRTPIQIEVLPIATTAALAHRRFRHDSMEMRWFVE